jgi:signal transduction histidine kinase/streptogramin lyase
VAVPIGWGLVCALPAALGASFLAAAEFQTDASGRFDVRWWTMDDGFPEVPLTGLTETAEGTLLCASRSRLVEFDGISVRPWQQTVTQPLHKQIGDFWSIGFDGQRRLWIQGRKAVACLTERPDPSPGPAKGRWTWRVFGFESGIISGMCFDDDGRPIVIGPNLACRFNGSEFVTLPLVEPLRQTPGDGWRFGCFDACHNELLLWGGVASGPFLRFGKGEDGRATAAALSPLPRQPDRVVTVGKAPQGALALRPDRVLARVDGAWEEVHRGLPGAASRISGKVVGSSDGTIWVSNHDELLACRDGRIEASIGGLQGFSIYTNAMLATADGTTWATCAGGLLMIRRLPFSFAPLAGCTVARECADGSILVGAGGTIWRHPGPAGGAYDRVATLPNSAVPTAVVQTETGHIWVGTQDAFIYRIAGGEVRQMTHPAEHSRELRSVTALACDRQDRIWAGTTNGLAMYDPNEDRFEFVFPHGVPSPVRILGLTSEADGSLLVASPTRGVERRGVDGSLARLALPRDLPGRRWVVMDRDSWGALWVGGDRGLLRITETGSTLRLSRAEGLIDEDICQIADDGHGRLWIATRRGHLQGIRLDDLERLATGRVSMVRGIVLNAGSMLGGAECRGRGSSALPVSARSLLVPFETGLIRLQTSVDASLPAVRMPTVACGQVVARGGLLETRMRVSVPGMHLDDPPTFQVRLDPIDGNWSAPTVVDAFDYPRLPAGHFAFRVRQLAGETDAEFPSVAVDVAVPTPWWRHPTVFSAATLLVSGAAAGLARGVTRWRDRRRIADLERQQERDRERARIARDIHDSLGAGLTRVALMSELARQQALPGQPVDTQLDLIYRDARALTRAVDEIVWAVNPANDTLAEFVTFIMQDTEDFARAGGLRLRLDVPTVIPGTPLEAHVRHHVCLCVREAVRNVLEHADAASLGLTIRFGGERMEMIIEDDGRGFSGDFPPRDEQDGLANIHTRIRDVGGSVSIESMPGRGTRIHLVVPVASFPPRTGRLLQGMSNVARR